MSLHEAHQLCLGHLQTTRAPSFLRMLRQTRSSSHFDFRTTRQPVSCTTTLPPCNFPCGRPSCQMVPYNASFFWDATAGSGLSSTNTSLCPTSPSQPTFGEPSLTPPYTEGTSNFIHDTLPTIDTLHLEFAGVHAIFSLVYPVPRPGLLGASFGLSSTHRPLPGRYASPRRPFLRSRNIRLRRFPNCPAFGIH